MYDQVTNTCYLLIFNNQTGVLCTGSPVFLEGIRHFVFFNLTVLVLFCMEYFQNSQYLCTFLHEVHLKFSVHVYCHLFLCYQISYAVSVLQLCAMGLQKGTLQMSRLHIQGPELYKDKAVFQLLITRVVDPRIGINRSQCSHT